MATAKPQENQKDSAGKQVSLNFAKEQIIENLFLKFNGSRPGLQTRLEAAYKEKYGISIPDADDVRAVFTEGPPGHGKTTIHREACKEFSRLVGLKFIEEPSQADLISGKVDEDSFVFSVITIAGATSKHEIGGLMAKMKVGEQEFMGHLPDWKLAATMMGAYGYIFFDDFTTAAHQVQNACFDLLLGGSAGDMNLKQLTSSKLKIEDGQVVATHDKALEAKIEEMGGGEMRRGASPVHIGLAANRGMSDGNKIFPRTTALTNRVQLMDVFDTPEEFNKRAMGKYTKDSLGDAHYSVFIKQYPEQFTIVPKAVNGNMPAFPSPRSHDAAMSKVRVIIAKNGGASAIAADTKLQDRVVREIEMATATLLGEVVRPSDTKGGIQVFYPSQALAGFYSELFLGAIPKAEEIILKGEVDEGFIKNKYNNGNDMDGKNFGFQFASALAQLAASEFSGIVKTAGSGKKAIEALSDCESPLSLKVRGVLKNLSMGVSFLEKSFVSYALDRFNTRLAALSPEIFEGSAYKILPAATMKTMMFGLAKDNTKYNTADLRETFVGSISQSYSANAGVSDFRDSDIKNAIKTRKDLAKSALSLS